MQFQEGEILLIDKPYRWTSFDVVNKIRSFLKHHAGIPKLKVGHAGTLDPLATGLLILCTGKFTKRIEQLQAQEKEYTGTFTFGATTPSHDMEKEVDQVFDTSTLTVEAVAQVFKQYTGRLLQKPPVFSAIKIRGKRAYKYARNDEAVEIKFKEIEIMEFEITAARLPEVDFRIVCSKGTYIRSLARDMGNDLGCGAYLSVLRRTRIGEFSIENAESPDAFKERIQQWLNLTETAQEDRITETEAGQNSMPDTIPY